MRRRQGDKKAPNAGAAAAVALMNEIFNKRSHTAVRRKKFGSRSTKLKKFEQPGSSSGLFTFLISALVVF